MDWHNIDWGTFASGGGIVASLSGGIYVWHLWRTKQQEATKGDIDVEDKKRKSDADFSQQQEDRSTAFFKAMNEEREARHKADWARTEARMNQLEAELHKRSSEHEECIRQDALKAGQISYLQARVTQLTQEMEDSIKDCSILRQRISALERGDT